MLKLDKSRAIGEVTPPLQVEGGQAHYEQDGFLFRHDGSCITEAMSPSDAARAKRLLAERAAAAAAKRAHDETMAEAGFEPEDGSLSAALAAAGAPSSPGATLNAEDIDLQAWAERRIDVPFFKVKAAFLKQHRISIQNRAEALQRLQEARQAA